MLDESRAVTVGDARVKVTTGVAYVERTTGKVCTISAKPLAANQIRPEWSVMKVIKVSGPGGAQYDLVAEGKGLTALGKEVLEQTRAGLKVLQAGPN